MIAALACWLSGAAFAAEPAASPEPAPKGAELATAITGSLVLAVTQKDATADALIAKTREFGGWFQSRDPEQVSLRVPVDRAEDLLAFAATQGKVLDRGLSRADLSQPLLDVRGRLEARQSMLKEYDAVLSSSTSQSIVSVQSAILQVIGQIENFRGQERLLEDQAKYARIDISFQFLDRSAPARDGTSSFRWLNTLNVQDVMQGMLLGKPDWKTGGTGVATPDGFSAWKKKSGMRAASPDGALFRVRTEKHKPKAELPFWREAVRERMKAAGYRVVSDSDFDAAGGKGGLIELVAPIGTEDWTYLVAFFPTGNRVVIAEAAAEVTTFEAHRAAIEAAMKQLAP